LLISLLALLITLALLCMWALREVAPSRDSLLSAIPDDSQTVLFADFDDLRRAPFFAQLLAAAPQPPADPAYQQFLRETSFDYEKDLARVALAITRKNGQQFFFAVADGHFDRKKFAAYAAKHGAVSQSAGAEIFSLSVEGGTSPLSFTFLSHHRIAFTNQPDSQTLLQGSRNSSAEWHTRFQRVAGSPLFAIFRNDGLQELFASPGTAQQLTRSAPGGLSSPQLASLLVQLRWLTLAGKPQNDTLRVVADGESFDDVHARQLADFLNGLVLLARIGLNNPATRRQITSGARDSYLSLLNTVEVSRLDRDGTRSVRLLFNVSPSLLASARDSLPPSSVNNKK
jgi:hypothetical protein